MHVRGLEEAQPVLPELDDRAIAHAAIRASKVPPAEVDASADLAAKQLGFGRLANEPPHAAALIRLKVRHGHVRQLRRIDQLRHCAANAFVHLVRAGMDQRRPLVHDQELVDRDPVLGPELGYAVNAVGDLVDELHWAGDTELA
jgi:hypothetical protein